MYPCRLHYVFAGEKPYYLIAEVSSIARYVPTTNTYTFIAQGQGKITDLDVDFRNSRVYWTDATKHGVSRATIGAIDSLSHVQNLTEDLMVEAPHGIAYDSFGE